LFGNKNIENKFVCSKWLSANEDLIWKENISYKNITEFKKREIFQMKCKWNNRVNNVWP
jgi:hypothetical protein